MREAGALSVETGPGLSSRSQPTALALVLSLGLHGVVGATALWLHFDSKATDKAASSFDVAFWPAAEATVVADPAPVPQISAAAALPLIPAEPPAKAVPLVPAEPVTAARQAELKPPPPPPPVAKDAVTLFTPPPKPKRETTTVRQAATVPQPLAAPPSTPVPNSGDQLAAATGSDRQTATPPASVQEAAVPASVAARAAAGDLTLSPPVVTHARFRSPPAPPTYPRRAIDMGQEGEVVIRALVGPDGESREIRIFRSSGVGLLDDAALRAVRRWAFEAAQINGRAVEAWVEVPVRFHLRNVL